MTIDRRRLSELGKLLPLHCPGSLIRAIRAIREIREIREIRGKNSLHLAGLHHPSFRKKSVLFCVISAQKSLHPAGLSDLSPVSRLENDFAGFPSK
ncbi:hypothetical protein BSZ32_08250 [Rubritalea profundi]|uniref:Uncharacterized protein n=1 Tax=Rubritalea profundi TaxID=1658618 RepID=A0A2S7U222_9BACT|nr:hypothetical protein BSZ32_08250 [Rubritalea profundi]